jgi:hypothetical protein
VLRISDERPTSGSRIAVAAPVAKRVVVPVSTRSTSSGAVAATNASNGGMRSVKTGP